VSGSSREEAQIELARPLYAEDEDRMKNLGRKSDGNVCGVQGNDGPVSTFNITFKALWLELSRTHERAVPRWLLSRRLPEFGVRFNDLFNRNAGFMAPRDQVPGIRIEISRWP
jgi:hypothetical protein